MSSHMINKLLAVVALLVACSAVSNAAVQSYIWNTTLDCSNIAGCDFYDPDNWLGMAPVVGVNSGGVIIDYTNTTFTQPQYITVQNSSSIASLFVRGPPTTSTVNFLDFQVWQDDSGLIVEGSAWFDQVNLAVHGGVFTINQNFIAYNESTITIYDSVFQVIGTTDVSADSLFTGTQDSMISLDGSEGGYIYFGCTPTLDSNTVFTTSGTNVTFNDGFNSETNSGMIFLNVSTLNGISSFQNLQIRTSVTLGPLASLYVTSYIGRGPSDSKPIIFVGNGVLQIAGNTQDQDAPTAVDLYSIVSGAVGIVEIVNMNSVNIDAASVLGAFTLDTVANATIGGAISPVDNATPKISYFQDFRLAGQVGLTLNYTSIESMSFISSQIRNVQNIGATISMLGQNILSNTGSVLNNTIFQVQAGSNFMLENDIQFSGTAGIYLMGEMTLNGTIINFDAPKPGFTLAGGSLYAVGNVTLNGNFYFYSGSFRPDGTIINGDYYQEDGLIWFVGVDGESLVITGDFTVTDSATIAFDDSLIPEIEAVIHVEGLPQVEANIIIQMAGSPVPEVPYYLISSLDQPINGMVASFQVISPVINSYKSSITLTNPALSMVLEFESQSASGPKHGKLKGWEVFLIILAVLTSIAIAAIGYRHYVRNKGYIAL